MDNDKLDHLYDSLETRLNTVGRLDNATDVTRVFRAVAQEFPDPDSRNREDIIEHMAEIYGIELRWVDREGFPGGWAIEYTIVDDVKYTMFLLKYSK